MALQMSSSAWNLLRMTGRKGVSGFFCRFAGPCYRPDCMIPAAHHFSGVRCICQSLTVHIRFEIQSKVLEKSQISVHVSSITLGTSSGGSVWWHRAVSTSFGSVSPSKNSNTHKYKNLWRDLFSDPSQWWDNRLQKPHPRFPDFKHKRTGEALWLDDGRNPPWVASQIDSITPGISVFLWAQRLSRFNKAGQYEKTLQLFEQMQHDGLNADGYIFVHVLNACAALQDFRKGSQIHKQIIEAGCELNPYVSSGLVDMYAKCGSIDDAWKVFDKMPTRDVVAWTAMILGCVKCAQGSKALELSQEMQREGIQPNSVTFVGLLNACTSILALEEGKRVHEQIIRSGFESDSFIGNSLVDMYAKCGSITDALRVFNKMPSRNVVTWNGMIIGCVKCGEGLKALELFQQMQQERIEPDSVTFVGLLNACACMAALEEGRSIHEQIIQRGCESDVYVGNSLVDMYAKSGSIDEARRVFDNMATRDVVTWNGMIKGYAMHGRAEEAVAVFEQMIQVGSEVDEITFICLLTACSHGGLVKKGKNYFKSMGSEYGVSPTEKHYTCMVDLLGRAGCLDDAEEMLMTMPLEASAAAWTSLLGACRIHSNVEMGERAAKRARELEPQNASGYVLLSNIYAASGKWGKPLVQDRGLKGRVGNKVGKQGLK